MDTPPPVRNTGHEGNDAPDIGPEPDGSFTPPLQLERALAAGIPVSPEARRRSLEALLQRADSMRADSPRAAESAARVGVGAGSVGRTQAASPPGEAPRSIWLRGGVARRTGAGGHRWWLPNEWLSGASHRLLPGLTVGAAAALTMVLAVRLTVGPTAAQPVRDALPGSLLHPVKLVGEQAHLGFLEITSGDEWCALYERQLAAERVRETELLLAAGARERVEFEGYVQEAVAPAGAVGGESTVSVGGVPVVWAPGLAVRTADSYVRVRGMLADGHVRVYDSEAADPP